MSAAVLLSAVAPSAPAKGAKVDARASSDAEAFGAALDEATPAAIAPEPALKTKAEAAAQPAAEPASTPEPDLPANDRATATPVLAAVVPPPPTVPTTSPLVADGASSEANTAAFAPIPAPTGDAETASVDGEIAESLGGSLAPTSFDAVETADQPLAQSTQQPRATESAQRGKSAETPAAMADTAPSGEAGRKGEPTPVSAEPAKSVAPVASDRARDVANVRSAVITPLRPGKTAEPAAPSTPETVPAAEGAEAEGSSEIPAPPPATTRVRDVIDRALARPSGQGATPAETQGARAEGRAPTDATTANKTPATAAEPSVAKSPIELPTVVLPPISADDAPVSPLSVAPAAPEARPAEAASAPVLSALSRAAVETTAQIAAQIVRKLEGRSTRFEMALTPDDLGRVDVSLDIDADGALHATLAFDDPFAATELRGRADELRRQLIEAGFSVADDALSFAERDPSAGQGGAFDREAGSRNARAFGAASRLAVEADLSLQTPAWISLSLTPAGVDMKV
jgi:flagellar hook-length control protein FliK